MSYGLFLILFIPLRPATSMAFVKSSNGNARLPIVYLIFALTTIASSLMGLATTGITVAIQRDW